MSQVQRFWACDQVKILPSETLDIRAMSLQPRKQLLNAKFTEGVTAFQDKSLQGHWLALRAM
jgi:hypothetical protein